MPGVQRSEGWSSTNPVTPPQPDWEHKHDMATLAGVPDQILEENNRWKSRNVKLPEKERRRNEPNDKDGGQQEPSE